MTDVRGTLIELFAQHSCAELDCNKQYIVDAFEVANFDEVRALQDYDPEYGLVRDTRRRIEKIASGFPGDARKQALRCLSRLKELRLMLEHPPDRYSSTAHVPKPSKEYLVLRELVRRTLYLKWPDTDRRAFDERVAVFNNWTDFFLSYTNRNATATNNRYEDLLNFHFSEPWKEKSINYVARVIAKYLEQEKIHGFADFKNVETTSPRQFYDTAKRRLRSYSWSKRLRSPSHFRRQRIGASRNTRHSKPVRCP